MPRDTNFRARHTYKVRIHKGNVRTYFEAALWLIFVTFALALLARVVLGEIAGPPVTIRSPLNVEGFVAVSFLLLLVIRAQRGPAVKLSITTSNRGATFFCLAALVVLCFAAFARSLAGPFLFDDYGHVMLAAHVPLGDVLASFYRPHQDIFFRPLGFLAYSLDFRWAHFDPFRWHVLSLVVHTVNCALVYVLTRQTGFAPFPAALGATVFAIHGTRAEAVSWTDARFDLLATFFVLLALVSFEQYAKRAGAWWLRAGFVFAALAIFTKEAAFSLPLMLALLSAFHEPGERRRLLKIVPALLALYAAGFVYRLWIIGGVGGYQTAGHANLLNFSALRIAKTLLWRLWAFAFFPLNWAPGSNGWIRSSMAIFLSILGVVAATAKVNRARLFLALLLTIAASLPVQSLLLLSSDLAGARILYLPMLGVAVLWAVVAEAYRERNRLAIAMAACVIFFNLACLERNIGIWTSVAEAARSACQTFGQQIEQLPGRVEVSNLPTKYRGVFFLSDAFPDCVEMNSGVRSDRVIVTDGSGPVKNGAAHRFAWNPKTFRFEEVKPF